MRVLAFYESKTFVWRFVCFGFLIVLVSVCRCARVSKGAREWWVCEIIIRLTFACVFVSL